MQYSGYPLFRKEGNSQAGCLTYFQRVVTPVHTGVSLFLGIEVPVHTETRMTNYC